MAGACCQHRASCTLRLRLSRNCTEPRERGFLTPSCGCPASRRPRSGDHKTWRGGGGGRRTSRLHLDGGGCRAAAKPGPGLRAQTAAGPARSDRPLPGRARAPLAPERGRLLRDRGGTHGRLLSALRQREAEPVPNAGSGLQPASTRPAPPTAARLGAADRPRPTPPAGAASRGRGGGGPAAVGRFELPGAAPRRPRGRVRWGPAGRQGRCWRRPGLLPPAGAG